MADYGGLCRIRADYVWIHSQICKSGKIMADYDGLWRIMADYGGLCRIMADYCGLWRLGLS